MDESLTQAEQDAIDEAAKRGMPEGAPALTEDQRMKILRDPAFVKELLNTDEPARGEYAKSPFPVIDKRPCYHILEDWAEWHGGKKRPGVYFCDKGDGSPTEDWICSPVHIEAITHDGHANNFGLMLRFVNLLGRWREWAMPMDMLAGDGVQLRSALLAMGVKITPSPKVRNHLPMYLQGRTPKREMLCAHQAGWHGKAFVLPNMAIGPESSGVIFQSGTIANNGYGQAGTLAGWKDEVARRARGNPLMMLSISSAFAGPMVKRCSTESGGTHGYAESSTGKSTSADAAVSVWGAPELKRSWKATANGMEGAAAECNDGLLALDEISECDPRDVNAIVYFLGNGRGKQRAGRNGEARPITQWRGMVISNGEFTIEETLAQGGMRVKAGQLLRLLNIPATGKYGAFDNLHGEESGAVFADSVKDAATRHYGVVGIAFLEHLTHDSTDYVSKLAEVKALPLFSSDESGQHKRAATRFALIGMAGELATDYGLTGWESGESIMAAAECFRRWQKGHGAGNKERSLIARAVAGFIERHGDARFSSAVEDNRTAPVRDRAGWWSDKDGSRTYLFTAEGMRDATKGFSLSAALDELELMGALPKPDSSGKRAHPHRIGGRVIKLYAIDPTKLEA